MDVWCLELFLNGCRIDSGGCCPILQGLWAPRSPQYDASFSRLHLLRFLILQPRLLDILTCSRILQGGRGVALPPDGAI